ncbi:MAG: hypothetical protein RIR79_1465 [Pseudomonadota bacterium]|jgi:zinc protease
MKRLLIATGLLWFTLTGIFQPSHAAPTVKPTTISGFTHVKTAGAIDEYRLQSNGLQVLLMPEHSSPTLTLMVTYRVGSRNEVTGTTGATHLLEHLMFKGSKNYNREKGNNVDQILERTGAQYNATTWTDRTNYYANMGREHLDTVMALEADRMRNLLLRESDRQPEMTVVRNEFEMGENSPIQALYKELYQTAFVAHPYHHSTIGHRSDIEKVSIDKLRAFYDTYYWPNNATVTVIGDFDPAQVLALVKKHFGVYGKSPKPIPEVYTEEPAQTGARRTIVKRPGELGVVAVSHKVPPATHPDFAAVWMMSAILADGKNSRLYQTITNKNLATNVEADAGIFRDTSLHTVFAPLAPNVKHEEVERLILQEIERLKKDGATESELQAAKAKNAADSAFKLDGSFGIAGQLNEFIAAGDWTLFYQLDESINKVTLADVQRVAQKYLQEDSSTTGWFVPTKAGEEPPRQATPATPPSKGGESALTLPLQRGSTPKGGGGLVQDGVHRSTIKDTGIDFIAYPMGVKDVVTLRATFPAGRSQALRNGGNPMVPTLAAMLLDEGTTKHDKFAIAQQLEAVGASIGFGAGNDLLSISAHMLKKDVPLVLNLIAEQLRTPAFSAEEFAKAKKQLVAGVQRSLESTDVRAEDAYNRSIYPQGHLNRDLSTEEMLSAIESATLEEVKTFHQTYYGTAAMKWVMTGDVDIPAAQAAIAQAFAGWTNGKPMPVTTPAQFAPPAKPAVLDVKMDGKTSVSVIWGQPTGLRYRDPDYHALRIATAILGSGFTGRLMATVRDQEGLTYSIGAGLQNDSFHDGDWHIGASFAPELLEKGIASTQIQLQKWLKNGVTEAEVRDRKTNLIGAFKVGLATTGSMAGALLSVLNRGYDPSWLDELPTRLEAITTPQVNAAIRKYLKPDNMVLVKAGSFQ